MSMLSLASFVSGLMGYTPQFTGADAPYRNEQLEWVDTLCQALSDILVPLLIIVATAGMIYAVVLGVNLARADSSEKQQEAKKRLIYAVVGLVCILVLILLLNIFVANVGKIIGAEYDISSVDDSPAMFLPFV